MGIGIGIVLRSIYLGDELRDKLFHFSRHGVNSFNCRSNWRNELFFLDRFIFNVLISYCLCYVILCTDNKIFDIRYLRRDENKFVMVIQKYRGYILLSYFIKPIGKIMKSLRIILE